MLKTIVCLTLLSFSTVLFSAENEKDIAEISESMGHLIGKNLDTLGLKFDVDKVIKGIQDATDGKEAPLSEEQCVEAIALIQEKSFHQEAEKNLEKAVVFLKENAENKSITELEAGKLQYRIEKKGTGSSVEKTNSPLIRYTGKYLDGTVFGSSEEGELISLDETISGFRDGILGMKEGEKRTLFIHPELGYGTNGFLKPNSLLTFEIEVIRADVPKSEKITTDSDYPNPELADPIFKNPPPQ